MHLKWLRDRATHKGLVGYVFREEGEDPVASLKGLNGQERACSVRKIWATSGECRSSI